MEGLQLPQHGVPLLGIDFLCVLLYIEARNLLLQVNGKTWPGSGERRAFVSAEYHRVTKQQSSCSAVDLTVLVPRTIPGLLTGMKPRTTVRT